MSMQQWTRHLSVLAFSLMVVVGPASAQGQSQKDLPGPIDSLTDIQDTGRLAFKLVDVNNDGQLSQKEMVDAGNLAVGGIFFQTDANGDGVVSKEEAKTLRDNLMAQKPMARMILERIKASTPPANGGTPNPSDVFMGLVDANNDGNLQATEVRQAVQTAVQGIYAAADTNRDGQMSPVEVNAAIVGAAKAAQKATFAAADGNGDGQISKDEFTKALTDPANAAFSVLDANNDGQLSQQELMSAGRIIESQIQRTILPEAAELGPEPDQQRPEARAGRPGPQHPRPRADTPTSLR